jgi:hypothetical protein
VAVAHDHVAAGPVDGIGHLPGHAARRLVVVLAVAPCAVDAGALGDDLDLGTGQLDQVAALEPDVLGPQVAGAW